MQNMGNSSSRFVLVTSLDPLGEQFEELLASRTARSSSPEISHNKPLTHDTLLIAPLTTYVMTSTHTLPKKIQHKVEEMGGEICPNVIYLGED
jgi:hypothetical protein